MACNKHCASKSGNRCPHQCQYVTFDVTKNCTKGKNNLVAEVANGWYNGDTANQRHFYTMDKGYEPFGEQLPLIMRMTICYSDNTYEIILTDDSFKTLKSPTTLANVFGSEDYDASMYESLDSLFSDSHAAFAKKLASDETPKGELVAMSHPPLKIKKSYETICITEPSKDVFIFDLGQNMSGLFEVFVKGKKGDKIRITPVEKLTPTGEIDKSCNTWSEFTLKGTGELESWKPSFSYSAGRWIQIEGATRDQSDSSKPYIADVKGHFVTSSAEDVGSFSCSDNRYNQIFNIILKAIESNLNHVHSDCPTVEKLGWLEPTHLMAPSVMYNKNVDTLWNKIARDVCEAQYQKGEFDLDKGVFPHEYSEGLIPSIAPRYARFLVDGGDGSFWDIIPWASTVLLAPLFQHQFYGNTTVMKDNYNTAKKYLAYLYDKYLRYQELYNKNTPHKFLCQGLGDWGIGVGRRESRENTETAFFYTDLKAMAKFAHIAGNDKDEIHYEALAKTVLDDYNAALLVKNPETGEYCYKAWDTPEHLSVMQANQAIPLCFGMVPQDKLASVKQSLVISANTRQFVAGEVGLPYLFRALLDCGRNDIINDMILQPEHPSYIRFVEMGETTLPEFWSDDARSRNHDMMGHIMEWFYTGVGGISSVDSFKHICIKPDLPGILNNVSCHYDSIKGKITVDVKTEQDRISLTVSIPANTTGVIFPPKLNIGDTFICNGSQSMLEPEGYSICGGRYELSYSIGG